MGTFGIVKLGVLISFLQTFAPGSLEEPTCLPGFHSDLLVFKVERMRLHGGRVLGKVGFDDCSGRTRFLFDTDDKRFRVEPDGTLKLKRPVALHAGHKDFSVHAWDSQGTKRSVLVRVQLHGREHHHSLQNQDHQNQNHHGQSQGHQEHQSREVDSVTETQAPESPAVPVLIFHKATAGLKRRKRAWVIPPINTPENERGLFPKVMVQIRSDNDKEVKILYSIQGPGADQPPVGLFTIDRNTGWLYVTQPLDREKQDKYTIQAHAVAEGLGVSEEPMDIIIKVIDMNDNKPVFAQDPFLGTVPEASALGFEFMKVVATDADEPGNANSDVRYEILSQEPQLPSPNMFTINPVTGGIRVKSASLDREKNPKYTLEVQAADMEGNGLVTRGKVVVTVSDSNDNAPQFVQTSYTATVPENQVGALVVKMPVIDADDPHSPAWEAVFSIAEGDPDRLFSITTGPNKQEGIITTAKALDLEKNSKYTLLVKVFNAVPFAKPLTTATATVVVTVLDVNEASAFNPVEKVVVKKEDLPVTVSDSNDNAPQCEQAAWVINSITTPENDKGPFPKMIVQIRTDTDKDVTVKYSIQGPGADQPPVGLFTIVEHGVLYVTQPLDREKQDKYTIKVHATAVVSGIAVKPIDIIINVIDMNDNKPVFTEDPLLGTVPEASAIDFEFMKVVATDADEPGNANSDVRYEILSQEPQLPSPNMFTINPVTGGIRVKSAHLDREKNPRYTLEVQAADLEGNGLVTRGKVVITVSDG